MNKVRKEMELSGEESIDDVDLWFTDVLLWNDYRYQMADLQDYFDFTFGSTDYMVDFFDKTEIFYPELYELEGIALSRLAKNKEEPLGVYEELLEEYNAPIVKRIIYLEKLGILEFLRKSSPFSTSVNMMANILGSIIDAKPSSIQPLLNPLLNGDVDNKNNPLLSKKNVLSVETYLTNIGYFFKSKTEAKGKNKNESQISAEDIHTTELQLEDNSSKKVKNVIAEDEIINEIDLSVLRFKQNKTEPKKK
jgi:hypothetical protein